MKLKPIKVSMLNQFIKKYLMSNSILNNLRVEGEISNIRMSKTGYTYFSLCDDSSCISCVCFFPDTVSKNGDKVVVEGEISLYEAKGTYQINVRNMERVGMGNILRDLELLKERMKAQGLFERSRELPIYPRHIGIITSKTGAAIKDILKTFESVRADLDITIYNVLVQGERSKQNIIDGIKYFNGSGADVILVSRGGGSFEDLSVFNETAVAEEVFKSNIPVVTGIGHETDRTLIDYAADVYCHTPTAAAEKIISGYRDVEAKLENLIYTVRTYANSHLTLKASELKASKYILKSYLPLEEIYRNKNELNKYINIIKNNTNKRLDSLKYKLELFNEKILNNNYSHQLEKGFSIVTDQQGKIIKNSSQVKEEDLINIIFKDFTVNAKTLSVKEVAYELREL